MRITSITVYQVDLPLSKPYWLSGGRLRFDLLDSTVVAIGADDGTKRAAVPWALVRKPGAHGALQIRQQAHRAAI